LPMIMGVRDLNAKDNITATGGKRVKKGSNKFAKIGGRKVSKSKLYCKSISDLNRLKKV